MQFLRSDKLLLPPPQQTCWHLHELTMRNLHYGMVVSGRLVLKGSLRYKLRDYLPARTLHSACAGRQSGLQTVTGPPR